MLASPESSNPEATAISYRDECTGRSDVLLDPLSKLTPCLACLTTRACCLCFQESVFGRTKSPSERLRENKRALTRAGRELERERIKLEGQEKKLIGDIKRAAKAGQMVSGSSGEAR